MVVSVPKVYWHHGQGGAASCKTRCPSGGIGNVSENASLSYPRTASNRSCLSVLYPQPAGFQFFVSQIATFCVLVVFWATSNAEVFWKKFACPQWPEVKSGFWRFCKVLCSTWGKMEFDLGVTDHFHISVKLRFLDGWQKGWGLTVGTP